MKTAASVQNIITRIAQRHYLDLCASKAHLQLGRNGFMPLVIEKIGPHAASVVRCYRQNGDRIANSDVVFFIRDSDRVCRPLF